MELRFPEKAFMPIAINVYRIRVLLVGGGRIALQKVQVLSRYATNIHIIAPEILPDIHEYGVTTRVKEYEESDLTGALIVYACTNITALNRKVFNDCRKHKILINVVDNPALCDFVMPAVYQKGYMSIAVSSNAESVLKSIEIRNKIKNHLEDDPVLQL